MLKPVTESFIQAVNMDVGPTPAAQCDFGIDTQEHYEALYYPIKAGEITAEELDKALGSGPALTALVARCKSNPHKDITFVTSYDMLDDEEY